MALRKRKTPRKGEKIDFLYEIRSTKWYIEYFLLTWKGRVVWMRDDLIVFNVFENDIFFWS